ncbi:Transcription factor DIVARICATA [Glycine max]|nr:Transcription factor DIVARICATA [Glycine max]
MTLLSERYFQDQFLNLDSNDEEQSPSIAATHQDQFLTDSAIQYDYLKAIEDDQDDQQEVQLDDDNFFEYCCFQDQLLNLDLKGEEQSPNIMKGSSAMYEQNGFAFPKNIEDELFLIDVEKYHKGSWKDISRDFVPSRNPTQIASDAQKYLERIKPKEERKRRSIDDDKPYKTLFLPTLSPKQYGWI